MKTHLFLISFGTVLGTSLLTTSYAANTSEYLHLTRHRDSNGNLLMAPKQHKAESAVMQKMMLPSQPKMFEQRSTDWGMSVQDVKDNERVQPSWDLQAPVLGDYEKRVAYHTQIEGIAAALTYTFYDNHLGQAKYVFEPQHADAVEYVQDFQVVKSWISQNYGPPTFIQDIWLDTLYQYDQSLWGQAVKRGHLVMVAEWNNPGTDIVLMLDGGNDAVGLVADFSSTTYVIPVSLEPQGEESIREAVSGTASVPHKTMEHVLRKGQPMEGVHIMPASESAASMMVAPASEHGIGEMPTSTVFEAVSNTQASVKDKTMEHVLREGQSMEGVHIRPVSESAASMMVVPASEHAFGEMSKSAVVNRMNQSEDMSLEPSVQKEIMDAHPTDEHADNQLMEAETELAPHHL